MELPHHILDRLAAKVDLILLIVQAVERKVERMSQVVDDLVAQVAKQKTVIESASTLMAKIFALLQAQVDTGDMAKVQQVLTDLKAQDDALAAAVQANTP